jgi:hypothetical protein
VVFLILLEPPRAYANDPPGDSPRRARCVRALRIVAPLVSPLAVGLKIPVRLTDFNRPRDTA